jgi:hypothetical protein
VLVFIGPGSGGQAHHAELHLGVGAAADEVAAVLNLQGPRGGDLTLQALLFAGLGLAVGAGDAHGDGLIGARGDAVFAGLQRDAVGRARGDDQIGAGGDLFADLDGHRGHRLARGEAELGEAGVVQLNPATFAELHHTFIRGARRDGHPLHHLGVVVDDLGLHGVQGAAAQAAVGAPGEHGLDLVGPGADLFDQKTLHGQLTLELAEGEGDRGGAVLVTLQAAVGADLHDVRRGAGDGGAPWRPR